MPTYEGSIETYSPRIDFQNDPQRLAFYDNLAFNARRMLRLDLDYRQQQIIRPSVENTWIDVDLGALATEQLAFAALIKLMEDEINHNYEEATVAMKGPLPVDWEDCPGKCHDGEGKAVTVQGGQPSGPPIYVRSEKSKFGNVPWRAEVNAKFVVRER